MKLHIRVQETNSYKESAQNFGFGHVKVIWHSWATKGPNMGVAVPRAPVGGWSPGPPNEFGHGSGLCLLVNCYLGNKSHKKFRLVSPPPSPPSIEINILLLLNS